MLTAVAVKLPAEKDLNRADNLKGVTMLSFMRGDEQEMMPNRAVVLLRHCAQLFEDLLSTDFND